MGYSPYQLVQDFFLQQYFEKSVYGLVILHPIIYTNLQENPTVFLLDS